MRVFEIRIPPELEGCTVEQVMRRGLGLSVTRIKRAKFFPDGIRLEGERVFSDHRVSRGQHLMVTLPERSTVVLDQTPGAVDILYEDDWLFVLNKPAGLPVHPGPGHYADTLGNRLSWVLGRRGEQLPFRPVNRLDKGTSGLMLAAKSAEVHEALQNLLHTEGFGREYLALTRHPPQPPRGRIDAPIGPVPGELNRYQVDKAGKPACTDYDTLETREDGALLRLKLHTGRTHQIRVHLAFLDCPLLGDTEYGGEPVLDRPALHSWRVLLRHPFTGESLQWTAPLPQDFVKLGWSCDL